MHLPKRYARANCVMLHHYFHFCSSSSFTTGGVRAPKGEAKRDGDVPKLEAKPEEVKDREHKDDPKKPEPEIVPKPAAVKKKCRKCTEEKPENGYSKKKWAKVPTIILLTFV